MSETEVKENEIEILVCPKHGEYSGEVFCYSLGGKHLKVSPTCPVCDRETEEKNRLEEERAAKQQTINRWRSMNIDEKYYESTFDNFDAYNDELRRHLEICRSFAEHPDGKLVMLGENGNGKTHLAVSVLKKLDGAIYTAYEIGLMLRQSYNNGDLNEWKIYNELCSVPILVIDEVEKIKDSEAKQNWMSYVIGKRYNRMLPLILIANCHTKADCRESKKPCPKCLEYHLENDVISRIIEDGIIIKFNTEDYRRHIRQLKFGG
jgi:DNA replication protein DnaC